MGELNTTAFLLSYLLWHEVLISCNALALRRRLPPRALVHAGTLRQVGDRQRSTIHVRVGAANSTPTPAFEAAGVRGRGRNESRVSVAPEDATVSGRLGCHGVRSRSGGHAQQQRLYAVNLVFHGLQVGSHLVHVPLQILQHIRLRVN